MNESAGKLLEPKQFRGYCELEKASSVRESPGKTLETRGVDYVLWGGVHVWKHDLAVQGYLVHKKTPTSLGLP